MKSHILVETANVKAGNDCLSYLLKRPAAHQVGMAMIYGRPGLGKTQFSQRQAIQNGYVYLSALKASTPKSFIADLLGRLRCRYEEDDSSVVGSRARLFRETVDLLNTCTTKDHMPVIIIDETDNIIHYRHEEIIGMLRDIADNTLASVVLVGMQDLREKVMRLNTPTTTVLSTSASLSRSQMKIAAACAQGWRISALPLIWRTTPTRRIRREVMPARS